MILEDASRRKAMILEIFPSAMILEEDFVEQHSFLA
jgi:hypothetical protein